MRWLWYFIIYSFGGFLLEVAFARAIHHPKRCLLYTSDAADDDGYV